MITVKEYLQINKFDDINKAFKLKKSQRDGIKADLMRGMIKCGECKNPLTAGITTKKLKNEKLKRYLYYKCESKGCKMQNKSVRARIITNWVYDYFEKHKFKNKSLYEHYLSQVKKQTSKKLKELKSLKTTLENHKRKNEKTVTEIKNALNTQFDIKKDKILISEYKNDLNKKLSEIEKINLKINKLNKEKEKIKEVGLNYKEFLELFEKLALNLRKIKSMKDLDLIIKTFFSNFTIKDKKVAKYKLKSPFDKLIKKDKFICMPCMRGRPDLNRRPTA
ncbi:MAG: hypothetical protein GF335_02075 [Candidatus Moranbacteria bacterium]|nr:hypothetical protein [Candidatus Moranbacteria bacterium]